MNDQMISSKKTELIFPRSGKYDMYLPKDLTQYKGTNFFRLLTADVNEIKDWFGQYTVDSIELNVKEIIQNPVRTSLIIGTEAEGGLKVTIRPKRNNGEG